MSKMAAIDVAVRLQLGSDGKSADYTKLMGPSAASAQGYNYDGNTLTMFLLNVANRLRLDTPPWIFSWQTLSTSNCLDEPLALLIAKIETATVSFPTAPPLSGGAP